MLAGVHAGLTEEDAQALAPPMPEAGPGSSQDNWPAMGSSQQCLAAALSRGTPAEGNVPRAAGALQDHNGQETPRASEPSIQPGGSSHAQASARLGRMSMFACHIAFCTGALMLMACLPLSCMQPLQEYHAPV